MELEEKIENENRLMAAVHRFPYDFFNAGPDGKVDIISKNKKIFWAHLQGTIPLPYYDIVLSEDQNPMTELQAVELTRHLLFFGYKCPELPSKKFQMALVFVDFDVIGNWSIIRPTDSNPFVRINLGRPGVVLKYSLADFRHKKCIACLRYAKGSMFKCNHCVRGGRNVYFCDAACFEEARAFHFSACMANSQSARSLLAKSEAPAALWDVHNRSCILCGKVAEQLLRCRDCFKATGQERLYCGRECQVKDWKKHKPFCGRSKPQPQRAAAAAAGAAADLVVSDYEDS